MQGKSRETTTVTAINQSDQSQRSIKSVKQLKQSKSQANIPIDQHTDTQPFARPRHQLSDVNR